MSSSIALVVALLSTACSGTTGDAAPLDSIPFAADEATAVEIEADASTTAEAIDDERATDEELYADDNEPAVDVSPDVPLTDAQVAGLLSIDTDGAAANPTDDAEHASVSVGEPIVDASHLGTVGVTVEHLMRELTLAYGGQGELLEEPVRTADGGTMSFSLTGTTIGDADNHRVDVEFSYEMDVDHPDMIVGHRADSITLTPFERE